MYPEFHMYQKVGLQIARQEQVLMSGVRITEYVPRMPYVPEGGVADRTSRTSPYVRRTNHWVCTQNAICTGKWGCRLHVKNKSLCQAYESLGLYPEANMYRQVGITIARRKEQEGKEVKTKLIYYI